MSGSKYWIYHDLGKLLSANEYLRKYIIYVCICIHIYVFLQHKHYVTIPFFHFFALPK